MYGPSGDTAPPPGPRYRRHLAEQPRGPQGAPSPGSAGVPDPFSTPDSAPRDAGPEFYARYGGICEQCFEPIDEDDLIQGVGDGDYIHAECYEDWCSA